MSLSPQSVEILLDLLEIKMGCMHIQDRDDAKELLKLRYCRQELLTVLEECSKKAPTRRSENIKFPRQALRVLQRQQRSNS